MVSEIRVLHFFEKFKDCMQAFATTSFASEHHFAQHLLPKHVSYHWTIVEVSIMSPSIWVIAAKSRCTTNLNGKNVELVNKVDNPYSVTFLIRTPIFEWYVVRFASKNGYQKDVFVRYWTSCSKYDDHSRLNGEHNWGGGPIWSFNVHKKLHFDNE